MTLDNKNVLDAQKVFVSMALINILKTPLSQLPFAISTTMQVSELEVKDKKNIYVYLLAMSELLLRAND